MLRLRGAIRHGHTQKTASSAGKTIGGYVVRKTVDHVADKAKLAAVGYAAEKIDQHAKTDAAGFMTHHPGSRKLIIDNDPNTYRTKLTVLDELGNTRYIIHGNASNKKKAFDIETFDGKPVGSLKRVHHFKSPFSDDEPLAEFDVEIGGRPLGKIVELKAPILDIKKAATQVEYQMCFNGWRIIYYPWKQKIDLVSDSNIWFAQMESSLWMGTSHYVMSYIDPNVEPLILLAVLVVVSRWDD